MREADILGSSLAEQHRQQLCAVREMEMAELKSELQMWNLKTDGNTKQMRERLTAALKTAGVGVAPDPRAHVDV